LRPNNTSDRVRGDKCCVKFENLLSTCIVGPGDWRLAMNIGFLFVESRVNSPRHLGLLYLRPTSVSGLGRLGNAFNDASQRAPSM
jgi:hypothetical protein